MPNIKGYEAPNASLSASERGAQANDTAGRRLGGLFNQAASDVRERGQLAAEGIKDRIWPYNILALNAKSAIKGTGFEVVNERGGSSGGRGRLADHGQASRGGAAMTDIARKLTTGGSSRRGSQTSGGDEPFGGQNYTLDQGRLVPSYGEDGPKGGYNRDAFERAQEWYDNSGKTGSMGGGGEKNEAGDAEDFGGGDSGARGIVDTVRSWFGGGSEEP